MGWGRVGLILLGVMTAGDPPASAPAKYRLIASVQFDIKDSIGEIEKWVDSLLHNV